MKTVNSMRAKYLSENEQVVDFALDISCMIETIFGRYPSLFEILECDECEYLGSRKTSMVNLSDEKCSSNLLNINAAIISKLSSECPGCQRITEHKYEFGSHIFIKVGICNGTVYLPIYSGNLAYTFAEIP